MSLEAGTVTTDRFLASKEARREGWEGGLSGDRAGSEEVGGEGAGAGGGSVQLLGSFTVFSFLEVMVMDGKVVWWTMDGGCLAGLETQE